MESAAVGERVGERGHRVGAAAEAPDFDPELARLAGARNVADAALVELVATVLAADAWIGPGIVSPAHWVTWKLGVTRSRAHEIVRIARRLDQLPTLAAVFAAGRLSFEQAHLIARHCPDDFEASVVQFAVCATITQLSSTLRTYGFDVDRPQPKEPQDRASAGFTEAGRYRLSLDLAAAAGAPIEAAIGQVRHRLVTERTEDARHPSLIDAITECFEAAAAADPSTSRRAAGAVLLHVDLDRLRSVDDELRLAGWFHMGPVLPSAWIEAGLCDADVQTLVSRGGRPVALGRSTKVIPPWLRSVILDRDGGCRFPGCGSKRFLDVHHIWHWCRGGPTDPSNLVCLCRRHHRAHHTGEYEIEGDPSDPTDPRALRFVDRCGRQTRPPPPQPPRLTPLVRYEHPLGERLDRSRVHFARRSR